MENTNLLLDTFKNNLINKMNELNNKIKKLELENIKLKNKKLQEPDATTFTTVCPGVMTTLTMSGVSVGDSSVNTSNIGASHSEMIELKRNAALLGVHTATPPTWTAEEIIRRSTTSNPKGKTIKINVIKLYKKNSGRKTIEFTVNTTDIILSLKQKIKTKEWIPVKEQKIFFKSKELLDGYIIGHFIKNNNEELFLHSNE